MGGAPREEFGPYVVYEQLGLGGMATVHRAEAKGIAGFSKQVALKRMLPSVAADASLVKSFIREAQLASQLRHENVAQTYDLGKVGDIYFIAMELVPGRNLREILKHCAAVVGHMPMPIAMNIVNQICDALDYAHNLCDESGEPLGIIHRDVSPSNIIVSEGGVVKLIDFGIAKASARTGMNTMTGTIKGKFSYMAPEYLMGSIDARVDLFALGVIAHELLANRPLFQGKDDMDTLWRVKDMPVLPPSKINPQVPPEIDAIIMTALERDPDQRWQRATALRQALTTETKRLGLVAHNSQVIEWIDWAFQQAKPSRATSGPAKTLYDADSEPQISITTGTTELPPSPAPHVSDELFNLDDGHATLVQQAYRASVPTPTAPMTLPADATRRTPAPAASDDWNGAADVTTPLAEPLPATPARSPSPRRSSPHIVRRNTPIPGTPIRGTDAGPTDDDLRTLPPRSEPRPSSPPASAFSAPRGVDELGDLPGDPDATRVDRPVRNLAIGNAGNAPGLAPRSDARAPTLMIEPGQSEHPRQPSPSQPMPFDRAAHPSQPMPFDRAAHPSQPMPIGGPELAAPSPPLVRTLPGPGAPGAIASPMAPNRPLGSPALSGARTAPRPIPDLGGGAGDAEAPQHAHAALDDLTARAERPAAGKLLGHAGATGAPGATIMKTRIEPSTRSGAGNFLLALLVLIAAGGAAAVVYFALP